MRARGRVYILATFSMVREWGAHMWILTKALICMSAFNEVSPLYLTGILTKLCFRYRYQL